MPLGYQAFYVSNDDTSVGITSDEVHQRFYAGVPGVPTSLRVDSARWPLGRILDSRIGPRDRRRAADRVPTARTLAPRRTDHRVRRHDEFRQRIASGLAATNAFEEMETERVEWVDRVGSTRFVDRIGSYSADRLVPTVDRLRVRDALIETLGDRTELQVRYVTQVFAATRRT